MYHIFLFSGCQWHWLARVSRRYAKQFWDETCQQGLESLVIIIDGAQVQEVMGGIA